MNDTGTSEAERGLNTPSTEDELADQILTAVSEGNEEEMNRLFSSAAPPDAASEEEEGSEEDPSGTEDEEEEQDTAEDEGGQEEEESTTTPSKQEPSPAEVRLAQLEKELSDAKASVGRMASLQSRLAQLEASLKSADANKKKAAEEEAESKLRERIAKLREVDPDTADLIELLADKRAAKEEPQPRQAQENLEPDPYIQGEYQKVLAAHADADSIFKHPAWHLWKDTLNPAQRSWAESSNSDEVIEALKAFKQYRDGLTVPAQAAADTQVEEDPTQAARKNKLERSATGGDKPIKKSPKFDEAKFFEESYAKIAKEAGIVY